jgi:hypothetical protein
MSLFIIFYVLALRAKDAFAASEAESARQIERERFLPPSTDSRKIADGWAG